MYALAFLFSASKCAESKYKLVRLPWLDAIFLHEYWEHGPVGYAEDILVITRQR